MTEAFVWGGIAASSLLIGGLLVMWRPISQRTLGLVMAFGAGALISAVAFELAAEAVQRVGSSDGGRLAVGGGLMVGAITFFAGDWWIVAFPGIALAGLILSINLLGDWLRDALNPKLR